MKSEKIKICLLLQIIRYKQSSHNNFDVTVKVTFSRNISSTNLLVLKMFVEVKWVEKPWSKNWLFATKIPIHARGSKIFYSLTQLSQISNFLFCNFFFSFLYAGVNFFVKNLCHFCHFIPKDFTDNLQQTWPNSGPRAACGPPKIFCGPCSKFKWCTYQLFNPILYKNIWI